MGKVSLYSIARSTGRSVVTLAKIGWLAGIWIHLTPASTSRYEVKAIAAADVPRLLAAEETYPRRRRGAKA